MLLFLYFSEDNFQSQLTCSTTTDAICYSTIRGSQVQKFHITRMDFRQINDSRYVELGDSDYYMSSNYAMNDDEAIFAGFEIQSSVGSSHIMFRYNFTDDSFAWKAKASVISKYLIKI